MVFQAENKIRTLYRIMWDGMLYVLSLYTYNVFHKMCVAYIKHQNVGHNKLKSAALI